MSFNPARLFQQSYYANDTGRAAIAAVTNPTPAAAATPTPVAAPTPAAAPAPKTDDTTSAVKVLAGAYAGSPTSSRLNQSSGDGVLSGSSKKGRRSLFLGL